MKTFRTKIKLTSFDENETNRRTHMALVSGVARALCISSLNQIDLETHWDENYFIISFECEHEDYEEFCSTVTSMYNSDVVECDYHEFGYN